MILTYSCTDCGIAFKSDVPHVVWTGDERRWIAAYYCQPCTDFQAARIEDLTSQLDHLQETLSGCDWC